MIKEESNSLKSELEVVKKNNEELGNLVSEFQHQINLERSRADNAFQKEREGRYKLDNALNESDKYNMKLQQLERQYNNVLEANRMEIQEKQYKYEKMIDQ